MPNKDNLQFGVSIMGKCPKCGKGLGLFGGGRQWDSQVFHSEWNGQMLHYSPCYLDAKFHGEAQVLKSLEEKAKGRNLKIKGEIREEVGKIIGDKSE